MQPKGPLLLSSLHRIVESQHGLG